MPGTHKCYFSGNEDIALSLTIAAATDALASLRKATIWIIMQTILAELIRASRP